MDFRYSIFIIILPHCLARGEKKGWYCVESRRDRSGESRSTCGERGDTKEIVIVRIVIV